MAGEALEVVPHVVRGEDAVVVVRRGADAAPGVALHEAEGGAVLDIGVGRAEVQAGVVAELVPALDLGLLDLGLVVGVVEHRTRHQCLRRLHLRHARRKRDGHHREVTAEVGGGVAAHERRHAEHAGRTPRAVGARLGRGVVVVERQVEGVADFPVDVEAERLVLVDVGQAHAAHRHVAVGRIDDLLVDDRRGHRAVGPGGDRRAEVEPHRQLVALLLDLVLGVGVVQRRGDVVGRRPLQSQLAVGALALHAVDAVVEVLRDRVDVGRTRAVGDVLRARRTRLRNRAPVVLVATERTPAVGHADLAEAEVALLVAAGQGDAELAVEVALAEDARDLGGDIVTLQRLGQVAVGRVVHGLHADIDDRLGLQRPSGADVDRRADAAGRNGRAAGLVDLHARDRFRRQVGEVECARVGHAGAVAVARGRHLPAIEHDHVVVRPDAADGDPRALAERAVDRHAADALQRLGQVGVRELADVLGHDPVDDALRVTLEVHRRGQASADALDHDRVERPGVFVDRRRALPGIGGGCGLLRIQGLAQCQHQCRRK